MKFLKLLLSFVLLCSLVACGTPNNSNTTPTEPTEPNTEPTLPTYPTNTYEYKFNIGENNEFTYRLVVTDYDDCSVVSFDFLYNGVAVGWYHNDGNLMDGVYDTLGLVFTIDNNELKVEKSQSSGGIGNVYEYKYYSGTYKWAENTYWENPPENAILILNEDGTAEFCGVAATYYPIGAQKVVLINNESSIGIVLEIMPKGEKNSELVYSLTSENANSNFSYPVRIDDYYKGLYGATQVYEGTGYFRGHTLYFGNGSFAIEGYDYYAGEYVEEESKLIAKVSDDSASATLVLSEEEDKCTFDLEIERQVTSGGNYINFYKDDVAFVWTSCCSGQFSKVSNLTDDSIIAVYDYNNHRVLVFNETLDSYYEIPGSEYKSQE